MDKSTVKYSMYVVVITIIVLLGHVAWQYYPVVNLDNGIGNQCDLLKNYPDKNWLDKRFNNLEVGLIKMSTDICSKLGGVWVSSENKIVFEEIELPVDVNAGIFQKVARYSCIAPIPSK